jgi:tetratricopeptide (TPR) repeat protein
MSSVDRNGPCPCGSGKKYKKCCAWKDATAAAVATRSTSPAREATTGKIPEGHFIAEIKPEVDDEVDRLLQRLERGEGQSVKAAIASLYQRYPRYHMTNYAMGTYVGLVEDDSAGAIPFFQEAVRILPPFAEAHYNLGSACFKCGYVGEAVAAFREAIRYSSGEDGLDKMAQEKIAELESILTRGSSFRTIDAFIENEKLFALAFEHLSNQHYTEAAELFGKVLKQNPRHVQSHGNLALCYASMGRKADALASLDRALQLDPGYEPARGNRKIIQQMIEGEPFVPEMFEETEYYRERLSKTDLNQKAPRVKFHSR